MRACNLKKIFTLLIAIMVVACLTACTKDTKTIIKFSSWGSKSEIDILQPLIDKFEQNNPDLKIEFMHIPQNYFQKIHLLFASNTAPDVIFINNLNLPIYANAGVLADLSSYEDKDKFYPQSLEALSWNNKLYAIPRDVSNMVIFYNKDLFDKNNIAYPKDDWTMDEFLTIAQKLTARPDVFGISFDENLIFYLPYLMSEGGGVLSDDLKEDIINNPKSQKGLNFYANLRKKYHVAPQNSDSASATMGQMFLQGRLGMYLTGRWVVPKFREDANFDWDIAPFPRGDAGSIVPLDASGWAVSKNSKHKPEALKFIQWLSTKENIEKMTKSGLIVPARTDVSVVDGQKPIHSEVFEAVIKTSKPTPVSVEYNVLTDKLKQTNETLFN